MYTTIKQERKEHEIQELWDEYIKFKCPDIRNTLALEYSYIVRSIAFQLRGIYEKYGDVDDIVNEGMIVLLMTIENFDPSKNVKFKTYATIRIRGAIIDYVRKQDWIPRRVKKQYRVINEARETLNNELGREPSEQEVMDYLDITEEEYSTMMYESLAMNTLSFEEMLNENIIDDNEFNFKDKLGASPSQSLLEKEFKQKLINAIETLGEKEQMILQLYYYEELKFKEIAYILDISTSRVSQLYSRSLKKLKDRLNDYVDKE